MTDPNDPTRPIERPNEPGQPTRPDEPGEPTRPVEPAQPYQPPPPYQATPPASPYEPSSSSEPTRTYEATPVAPVAPAAPVPPAEPVRPVEPVTRAAPIAPPSTAAAQVVSRRRHPFLGLIGGLLLGLGIALLMISYAFVPFGAPTPYIVIVIFVILGLLWGLFGPTRGRSVTARTTTVRSD